VSSSVFTSQILIGRPRNVIGAVLAVRLQLLHLKRLYVLLQIHFKWAGLVLLVLTWNGPSVISAGG